MPETALAYGIRSLILLLGVTGIFMMGPFGTLLPQVAKEELGREAFEASLLLTFVGLGMVISSLAIASVAFTTPALRKME